LKEKTKREGGTNMIYSNVKKICDERKISIASLERAIGLGNGTISGWRNSSPRVDILKKVTDYFEVSLEYFLDDEGEE
jgi:transcriptional regulator with XRE-family HTH domain